MVLPSRLAHALVSSLRLISILAAFALLTHAPLDVRLPTDPLLNLSKLHRIFFLTPSVLQWHISLGYQHIFSNIALFYLQQHAHLPVVKFVGPDRKHILPKLHLSVI